MSEDGPVHWRWEQVEPFGENPAIELMSIHGVSALGQRVRKTVTTCDTQTLVSDTLYVYDLAGHLIAETTPTGQYKRAYIHLGDIPVGMFHETYD